MRPDECGWCDDDTMAGGRHCLRCTKVSALHDAAQRGDGTAADRLAQWLIDADDEANRLRAELRKVRRGLAI